MIAMRNCWWRGGGILDVSIAKQEMKGNKPRELLIISASPADASGDVPRVFEPTLREVEALAPHFDKIVWYTYPNVRSASSLYRVPNQSNIEVRCFPVVQGGRRVHQKVKLAKGIFTLSRVIFDQMRAFKYIHTRGPSVPALLGILLAWVMPGKHYWHKYAGNWGERNPPLGYGLQRFMLNHIGQPVTINGRWPNMRKHVLSFENPCFSSFELSAARQAQRSFTVRPWRVLFVGRLEIRKGINVLLDAARSLSPADFQFFLAGPGHDDPDFIAKLNGLGNVHCLGELSRSDLNDQYKHCHFLLLPSLSEGFPKVVSEALGFGCIPIVTDISSIGQYVNSEIGFLLKAPVPQEVVSILTSVNVDRLEAISENARAAAEVFTYERFAKRIAVEVFQFQST